MLIAASLTDARQSQRGCDLNLRRHCPFLAPYGPRLCEAAREVNEAPRLRARNRSRTSANSWNTPGRCEADHGSRSLLGEADAALEVPKARIGTKRVQSRPN